jgi:hypothetical protein
MQPLNESVEHVDAARCHGGGGRGSDALMTHHQVDSSRLVTSRDDES